MLRLVLLVLYLIASASMSSQQSAGTDPSGLSPSPPASPTADAGAGYDPNGGK